MLQDYFISIQFIFTVLQDTFIWRICLKKKINYTHSSVLCSKYYPQGNQGITFTLQILVFVSTVDKAAPYHSVEQSPEAGLLTAGKLRKTHCNCISCESGSP